MGVLLLLASLAFLTAVVVTLTSSGNVWNMTLNEFGLRMYPYVRVIALGAAFLSLIPIGLGAAGKYCEWRAMEEDRVAHEALLQRSQSSSKPT